MQHSDFLKSSYLTLQKINKMNNKRFAVVQAIFFNKDTYGR